MNMNTGVYSTTFAYWIISALLAILSNGFIIFIAGSMIFHSSRNLRWTLQVDQITVISIMYLAVMDFLFGLTFLMIMINNMVILGAVTEGEDQLFGGVVRLDAPLQLLNYGMFNGVVNKVNVLSWTANILIILMISIYRTVVVVFPTKRVCPRTAHIVALTSCFISALYAAYPIIVSGGKLESNACGERKAFLINELCAASMGEEPSLKFGDMTFAQQAGILMYCLYYLTFILTLGLNLVLLVKAVHFSNSKSRSTLRPIITTFSISILFLFGWALYIAWISFMYYLRWRVDTGRPIDGVWAGEVASWLKFWEYILYTISSWGNAVIYVMINRHFRKLVADKTNIAGRVSWSVGNGT